MLQVYQDNRPKFRFVGSLTFKNLRADLTAGLSCESPVGKVPQFVAKWIWLQASSIKASGPESWSSIVLSSICAHRSSACEVVVTSQKHTKHVAFWYRFCEEDPNPIEHAQNSPRTLFPSGLVAAFHRRTMRGPQCAIPECLVFFFFLFSFL